MESLFALWTGLGDVRLQSKAGTVLLDEDDVDQHRFSTSISPYSLLSKNYLHPRETFDNPTWACIFLNSGGRTTLRSNLLPVLCCTKSHPGFISCSRAFRWIISTLNPNIFESQVPLTCVPKLKLLGSAHIFSQEPSQLTGRFKQSFSQKFFLSASPRQHQKVAEAHWPIQCTPKVARINPCKCEQELIFHSPPTQKQKAGNKKKNSVEII